MTTAAAQLHDALRPQFKGELLRPGDPDYDLRRGLWNGMADRRPALIARCLDEDDVRHAVREAAALGILTAIRCGGHSLAGHSSCDDGLMLDLSAMDAVTVDPESRTAFAEGGCLLGSVDRATVPHGLAFPAGVVSHTGASGLILGGGVGWLTRRFGLSCDNVIEYRLVTASGDVVTASAAEDPELFWALRGGGGNFGVVTRFKLQLHPVRRAVVGSGYSRVEDLRRVLEHWAAHMPEASRNFKWGMALRRAPSHARVPDELHGALVASHALVWTEASAEGEEEVRKVLSAIGAEGASVETVDFLTLQTCADSEFPHGRQYYSKSGYFEAMRDDTIATLIEHLQTIPSATTQIELSFQGGAAGDVAEDETAYGSRQWPFLFNLLGSWDDPQLTPSGRAWVRSLFDALKPSTVPGLYVNFASDDDQERIAESYGGRRWERLVRVKQRLDPGNFFRLNQNIQPHEDGEAWQ